jgi:hypothetical protein
MKGQRIKISGDLCYQKGAGAGTTCHSAIDSNNYSSISCGSGKAVSPAVGFRAVDFITKTRAKRGSTKSYMQCAEVNFKGNDI